jgi:UDP-glucuronate decarboxylase
MLSHVIKKDIEEIYSEFSKDLKSLENKDVLITGGNGFFASYLVDLFEYNNSKLKNPSRLKVINRNGIKKESRLSHLLGNPNVEFFERDVGKPFQVPKADIIIHAASRSNLKSFLEDPLDTIDANVNGLRTLLEYSRDNPLDNFLFFSTAEVYGNPVKEFIPTPENYPGNVDCTHPMAAYIESKRLCETLSTTFFRKFNTPVKNLRILLTYGPGMRNDGKVISDFYTSAKENNEINLRDRGDAKRSFCYITDGVRGVLKIMFNGKSGEAYNIGNDLENPSIQDVAYKISEILGNTAKVNPNMNYIDKQTYGLSTRLLDISKLRSLGFEPRVNLEEGLLRLKEHVEKYGWGI